MDSPGGSSEIAATLFVKPATAHPIERRSDGQFGMGSDQMNRYALALGCVAGLVLPSVVSAALSLNINGPWSDYGFDVGPVPASGAFDLVFAGDTTENGAPVNEGLFAYD